MVDEHGIPTFRLARMSPLVRNLTFVLLALPVVFAISAASGAAVLGAPAVFVGILYAWVWFRFRPTRFIVHRDRLEIVWPLKQREILKSEISQIRVMSRPELMSEIGSGMRIGAGGLWGAFGWLKTKKRGIVQMYISRTDRFVWIERNDARPWLITPENPELFAEALRRP